MNKKIRNILKSIKLKDIISFLVPIVIAIILIIPVPYYVTVGGGTLRIDDNIKVENEMKSKGSLNSAYVKEMNGTVLTYLLAKIIPSYELTKTSDVVLDNEEKEDYSFREKLYFTDSLDAATKVAFDYLGKEVKVKKSSIYVIHVDKQAKTSIKAQDKIVSVNGIKVFTIDDISNILKNYLKDEINITVIRDNKEINTTTKLQIIDNEKKLGIYLMLDYSYETDPKVSFNFSNREAGPSGGLMLSLSIYNKLVSDDITKGKKIVGTGTIDYDGNVGEIGGIKYKLMGAVKSKADVFIVPYENYEEAKKLKEEKNYDIKIIKVATFKEAIDALKNI